MGKKIWNVVLVPEGGGTVRNLRIPVRFLYVVATIMATGLFVVIGSVGFHLWTLRGLRKAAAIRQENASLRSHLDSVNRALEQVEAMVRDGEQMERQARILAGLDPDAGSTTAGGLGGPLLEESTQSETTDPILSTLTDQDERLDALTRKVSDQRTNFKHTLEGLRSVGDRISHTPSTCPLRNGFVVSSGFGWRTDPFTAQKAFHSGLDLRAESGTPIFAPADGEVSFVGWDGEFGLCVRLHHGYGLESGYFHLSATDVKVGQSIHRGEPLGKVGSSGRSTAPHLHYEVYVNGVAKDPSPYIASARAFGE